VLDQECVRMLRTVEDILDVSRVEAGALHLARTRLQLARLVHRSIAILAPQIQARRTNLRVSCPDGAGFVDADPGKMERALVNVLGNAIKFTKPEGLVEVGIGADPAHPQCLVVSVIDNGIGIAPHQIEKVTEKFYRAGEHISGTGLGLYLARQTIELHGGRLEIASPPPGREKGTRVSVVLPAARAPVLLLSGGDPATLAALQAQVGAHDYRVLACTPADDVDAILADRRADLAVVDFSVQPAWGLDLVRRIKSHDAWAEAPILVVTPLSPDFAEQEFLKELALRILPKPWQENDLLNALEAALLRDETPARAD
jgi:CheY-like chemotaxis protein/anti-sigma regulatory factor (Ser/Thr protein kinase)